MSLVIKMSKARWNPILVKKGVVFIELFIELLKQILLGGGSQPNCSADKNRKLIDKIPEFDSSIL